MQGVLILLAFTNIFSAPEISENHDISKNPSGMGIDLMAQSPWKQPLILVKYALNSRHHRAHRRFQEGLVKSLMTYYVAPDYNPILRPIRTYCAYCGKNQLNQQPKHQKRSFGTDITNIGSRFRGSRTQWGCDQCNVPLCKIGDC